MVKMSKKHIIIEEDVWAELQKLKGEYRLSSFSEVLRKLLNIVREGAM